MCNTAANTDSDCYANQEASESRSTPLEMGTTQKCSWAGDMVFYTFDRTRLDPYSPASGATWWAVKSEYLQVQVYTQAVSATDTSVTRGVAFSGKLLLGHTLVIKKDVNFLKGAGMSPTYEGWSADVATKVFWDGVEKTESFQSGATQVTFTDSRRRYQVIRTSMPLGISSENKAWRVHMDNWVSMGAPPGGQDGLCGNNNGDVGDDSRTRLQNNPAWDVPDEENLFLSSPGRTIDDCAASDRLQAEAHCKENQTISASDAYFLDICIFEECFNPSARRLPSVRGNF